MLKFIETLKNIWTIDELKNRIFLTLFFLIIYRLAAQVVLPGVDYNIIADAQIAGGGGLLGLLNAFTGGAFANASVVALGIMPYISASIVVQLMGVALPYLQKLQKEGESGRKKITQITDRGIGNGISLLITVGIIASLPLSFTQEVISQLSGSGGLIMVAIEFVIWIVVIALCILLVLAVRQIPVQYARRSVAGSGPSGVYSKRQYIPLRLNASGVMPIIFAQAIMFAPAYLGQLIGGSLGQWMNTAFSNMFGLYYNILFGLLIVLFTYFYTAITVPTNKMADDLKRSGGFIPGIKPGGETADFLDKIMSLITFPGSLFLAAISVLPAVIVALMNIQQGWALFYGGTSLLIMVGVAIDTIQQINAYLLNRHYDGLMKSGKTRRVA